MNNHIFTVTALNTYVKDLLDSDIGLAAVTVQGEISNYKAHPSGHHYFSLKDGTGTLKCVMFKGNAINGLRFRPQNGMKVVAMGRVGVFLRDGVYQLYVSAMRPEGLGELYTAFEELKERLQREGLFDPDHKKPIPPYPERIALVSSLVAAGMEDALSTMEARWPMSKVCILPVRVQGTEAGGEISRAIDYANATHTADVIILGRGGGPAEDLWCFNDEAVARAIYRSEIPVISAVGHEKDVTIADLVADLRAATPTKAAVVAVPDQNEVYDRLGQMSIRLSQQLRRRLTVARESLRRFERSRVLSDPMNLVEDRRMLLDRQSEQLATALTGRLAGERQRFATAAAKLDALSPLKVLGRGYAIPQKGDRVVRSAKELAENEQFTLRLRDGNVPCRVEKG